MECYSYYGIEKSTFRKKSDFGVDFSYVKSFFKDMFSHALVIDLSEGMIVLFDW